MCTYKYTHINIHTCRRKRGPVVDCLTTSLKVVKAAPRLDFMSFTTNTTGTSTGQFVTQEAIIMRDLPKFQELVLNQCKTRIVFDTKTDVSP